MGLPVMRMHLRNWDVLMSNKAAPFHGKLWSVILTNASEPHIFEEYLFEILNFEF